MCIAPTDPLRISTTDLRVDQIPRRGCGWACTQRFGLTYDLADSRHHFGLPAWATVIESAFARDGGLRRGLDIDDLRTLLRWNLARTSDRRGPGRAPGMQTIRYVAAIHARLRDRLAA